MSIYAMYHNQSETAHLNMLYKLKHEFVCGEQGKEARSELYKSDLLNNFSNQGA